MRKLKEMSRKDSTIA